MTRPHLSVTVTRARVRAFVWRLLGERGFVAPLLLLVVLIGASAATLISTKEILIPFLVIVVVGAIVVYRKVT